MSSSRTPMGPNRATPGFAFPAFLPLLAFLALPAEATDLFTYAPQGDPPAVTAAALLGPGQVSRHTVRVDGDALASAPESLWLEVAPGEHRLAVLGDLETTLSGGRVWRGRFLGDQPGSTSVVLSQHGDLLYGGFASGGVGYTLRPVPGGLHVLEAESLGREFHCDLDAAENAVAGAAEVGPATPVVTAASEGHTAAAAANDMAFLVVYPESQVETWGGLPYAVAHAHHVIDSLNTAFADSRINGRAFLAGVRPWSGIGASATQVLNYSQRDTTLLAYRDEAAADVVTIFAAADSCGVASLMKKSDLGPQFAASSFNVTTMHCDSWNHQTTVHEVGHNLGANHPFGFGHNALSRQAAVFPYAFAWESTVMSYASRYLVFSNPEVTLNGEILGSPGEADNARALSQTIPVVAAFRSGGTPVPRNGVQPPVQPRPRNVPPPASDLRARVLSATEVELSWMDNAGDDRGFRIEGEAPGTGWVEMATAPRNESLERVVYVLGGLQPATRYRFRVLTLGIDGPSYAYSNLVQVTTDDAPVVAPPTAPTGLEAEPGAAGTLVVSWQPMELTTGYRVRLRTADPAGDRAPEAIAYSAGGAILDNLAPSTPYTLQLRAVNEAGVSPWSEPVSVTTSGAGGPCVADGGTLCLSGGRFEVRAAYRNPHAGGGHGQATAQAIEGSERTGFFTFFNPANVELGVKMLDGRALNGNFWVFYGALSDVEYWLSVRDTVAGGSQTYHNPAFELCGLGDTGAFPRPLEEEPGGEGAAAVTAAPLLPALAPLSTTAAANAVAEAGACVPGPEALCLAGGRFQVEVEWENPHDGVSTGTGKVMPGLGTDLTGHFWFFRPDNLELSVKILDGTAINGHHWIFWGGLSDVGYTLIVTDTEDGEVHRFTNPPLTLCGGSADDVL